MDVSVPSILTGATDANPARTDQDTGSVEAKQPHECSLFGVSRERVILLMLYRAERSSAFGPAARCHVRGIAHED